MQISAAFPVCDPNKNLTSGAAEDEGGDAEAPTASTASDSGAHNCSVHGSTASSSPTASFASPRWHTRSAPRKLRAESSVCAAWLQSFAVVVCRSRSRFVSPKPSTAYLSLPASDPASPFLR